MQEIPAFKAVVSKVMPWLSSKRNAMRKLDVVHDICDTANRAYALEGFSREYRCGIHTTSGALREYSYSIIVKGGIAILTNHTTGEKYRLLPKNAR